MADVKNYMIGDEKSTLDQIDEISSSPAYEDETIRIMPDAHCGKGSCIGFTSTYSDKIVPNTVGVDIACRVSHYKLPEVTVDDVDIDWFDRLDEVARRYVPTGFKKRKRPDERSVRFPYEDIKYWEKARNKDELVRSMGTLGGGNHYVELDKDEEGNLWLAVHTGSRNLGLQVCNYYQGIAGDEHPDLGDLAYIDGEDMDDYLNDMALCNRWSYENHMVIMKTILVGMRVRFDEEDVITCIHNYVDVDGGIIRKGAISARSGEIGAIPLNMHDGTLLVKGAGNPDWNYSLPHGAGRVLSRSKAFETLSMDEFSESMKGIYSTSVMDSTLDEAPKAYKSADAIIESVSGNGEVVNRLLPVYNMKDRGRRRKKRGR